VFICREAGADLAARDVCSMNPDGSGLVNLTRTPEAESTPDVSPDGTRIAFTRRASDGKSYLWVMNADGSIRSLRFVFPPEQVAPYEDGAQSVEVPASVLLPLVAATYRPLFRAG